MINKKIPNPEVKPKPGRRKFSAAYKLKILREADECREHGQIGALLRREGLYSAHLSDWRKQREEGILAGLSKPKGRPPESADKAKIRELEKQVQIYQEKLRKAEFIIDVQKKISDLLDLESPENSS